MNVAESIPIFVLATNRNSLGGSLINNSIYL